MKIELLPHERLDDLQNGYEIIQDPGKFCFEIGRASCRERV